MTAIRVLVASVLTALVGALLVLPPASPAAAAGPPATAGAAPTDPSRLVSGWTPRPEQYPRTVTRRDLPIRMSDGVVLRGDLTLPARADGTAAPGRRPVVVTITAYNKSVLRLIGSDYLVKRGYAQLVVDARGTGSSQGSWCAFCTRENLDSGEIMTWAADRARPWSDGRTAMTGASYMGISQLFAASHRPKGLKAIFPQVPAADVYRDVVASGGQLDVGFIPLWMGLVTATGVLPPAVTATDPAAGLETFVDHLAGLAGFTLPTLVKALGGMSTAYDGDFYRQRSPIERVDRIDVPTFLVGGEHDLFQRGTPLLFERLQRRGVPTKLVLGPWNHLEGSMSSVEEASLGTLEELQLRWFDRYVLGRPDPGLDRDLAPVTYYEQGAGTWRTAHRWVDPATTSATVLPLAGRAAPGRPGRLGVRPTTATASPVHPVPVQGLCSRSASQWTAGLPSQLRVLDPVCFDDNRINDATATVFETAPLTREMSLLGPVNASLRVSSTTGGGMVSVAVSDVAPDGSVTRLTGGWQVISHRALDRARSRYVDGQLLQPYHPHTRASVRPARPGEVVPVDVEVFPTGARLQKGHRLRVSVQAFDVPHLMPTLPQLPGTLGLLRVHSSPAQPSQLVLPTVG